MSSLLNPSLSIEFPYLNSTTYLIPAPSLSATPSSNSTNTSQYLSSNPSQTTPPDTPPIIKLSASPSRPTLRHMPSWSSFVSQLSRASRRSLKDEGDRELEDVDGEEGMYDDADDEGEYTVTEKRDKDKRAREREDSNGSKGSFKSSRKGFTMFKKFSLRSSSIDRPNTPSRTIDLPSLFANPPTVDTPLDVVVPRTQDSQAYTQQLPTMMEVASPPMSPPEEWHTPAQFPTSLLATLAHLPAHLNLPSAHTQPATTFSIPSPSPEAVENAEEDTSLEFNLDIFSPRLPPAPTLRGIMDGLPISPLNLPSPDIKTAQFRKPIRPSLFRKESKRKSSWPTPILPRDPTTSPIVSQPETTIPSFGMVFNSISTNTPITAKSPPCIHTTSDTPISPTPISPPRPTTLPRGSLSALSPVVNNTNPYRRHSSIALRPSILPCPTPPSLLNSPRQLGTPIIVPSPKHAGCHCNNHSPYPADTLGKGPKRGSGFRSQLGVGSGVVSPTGYVVSGGLGGLGLGQISGSGFSKKGSAREMMSEDEEMEKGGHVDTPGTFGLQGEAERRLEREGLNPYFA